MLVGKSRSVVIGGCGYRMCIVPRHTFWVSWLLHLCIQLVLVFEFMQSLGQSDGCSCRDCVPNILPQLFLETQVLENLVLMIQNKQPWIILSVDQMNICGPMFGDWWNCHGQNIRCGIVLLGLYVHHLSAVTTNWAIPELHNSDTVILQRSYPPVDARQLAIRH